MKNKGMDNKTSCSVLGRRGFLKSALSCGALAAVSRLPALADDPAIFPDRGRFERLSIAKVHVDAGARSPFSVLHISDTHFTDAYPHEDKWKQQLKKARTQTFGGRQEEAFSDSIAWAKANCDYLLHTGDIIDWLSQKNLDLVKQYFGENMFGAVGNHEYSPYMWLDREANANTSRTDIRAELKKYFPFDIPFASQEINGVNFVSIDDSDARVTPEQVERFKKEVDKGLPIVIIKHIPFYTDYIWRQNAKFWKYGSKFRSAAAPDFTGDALTQRNDPTTRDFIAYLKTVPQLKAILAGHLHITVQDRFSPTAMEYVVGGNFLFHGQEVTFS